MLPVTALGRTMLLRALWRQLDARCNALGSWDAGATEKVQRFHPKIWAELERLDAAVADACLVYMDKGTQPALLALEGLLDELYGAWAAAHEALERASAQKELVF